MCKDMKFCNKRQTFIYFYFERKDKNANFASKNAF